jgi:uncharacterized protein
MHLPKKGLRVFGIAESYTGRVRSVLAGVVMRKDLRIDGFAFGFVEVGGKDATEEVIRMAGALERSDLNAIMLSGCVIAWFNVMDPEKIAGSTNLPVICVTYEDSDGLAADILHHFPDDAVRLRAYEKLGDRRPVDLGTGQRVFVRSWGISPEDAARFCNDFTLDGKIPEPLRVARLCARRLSQILPGTG